MYYACGDMNKKSKDCIIIFQKAPMEIVAFKNRVNITTGEMYAVTMWSLYCILYKCLFQTRGPYKNNIHIITLK